MTGEDIRAKKCTQCGTINHLTKLRCLKCRGSNFEEVTHPACGIVLTFTNCTALPERLGPRKSQGFAIIQLQQDWNILGQLENPDDVSIGTRVIGKWSEVSQPKNLTAQTKDENHTMGWIFRKEENKS